MELVIMILGVIILIFTGLPVAFSLGLASLSYFLMNPLPLGVISQSITKGSDSFIMLALPLFIASGTIMNKTGITDRIFRFSNNLVGHIPGGLGHVNVVVNMVFAGMSGSILADVGGVGQVLIKVMKKKGFNPGFSAAVTSASALIAPIIPPSILFVVYGGLTGTSIGALFVAGAIPGVLMGIFLMVAVYIISVKRNYPIEERASFLELIKSFYAALPAFLTPIIIVGGMLAGIFTPTESSAIACIYAIFLGLVYKEITLKSFLKIAYSVVTTTSSIMFLLAMAKLFSWILIREQAGLILVNAITSFSDNTFIILLLLVLVALFLGCFMDAATNLIIIMPLLMPLLTSLGVNMVYFGVFFVITLAVGSMTPPVGMGMYLASSIAEIQITDFLKEAYPFIAALMVCVFLLMLFPIITLWLPSFFYSF